MSFIRRLQLLLFLAGCLPMHAFSQTGHFYIRHAFTDSCLIIQTNRGFLKVQPYAAEIVEIAFSPISTFAPSSDAVLHPRQPALFYVTNNDTLVQMRTDQLYVKIRKRPLTIVFTNIQGEPIASEITGGFSNNSNHGFRFSLSKDEKITGGGVRALPLNRRGYLLKLNNEPHWGYGYGEINLNYSVPVFLSSRNYMLFYDAPQRATADIGKTSPDYFDVYSAQSAYSCFVIIGNTCRDMLISYTKLTGTQPIPPRWAFGNLQSRFGYKSQTETLNKADSLITAGYPLDAMIIDLYWFGKGMGDFRMGDLWWEPDNWPDPEAMIKALKKKGVKTILITEPYVLTNAGNYGETDALKMLGKDSTGNSFVIRDFWFGPAGIIDVFNPIAIDWFWSKYKKLKEQGVQGWWGDLGEPERHPSGIYYTRGTSDNMHNVYGHYWSKLLADKYKLEYPNERLFFLNRAGYAGSQRYSVFPWSGDVSRSWSGFKAQLPIMLGMSLNGIPYMHSDLGGFAAGVKDEELYTRWLQFGVFNPIFRPHGESIPSEPIFFNDTTQRIVRDFIKLRYRFMPYNYTLAWRQAMYGEPLAKPLMYSHPENKNLFDIDSVYYWGNELLVAPILVKGQKERKVYLPKGHWFSFFKDAEYEGDKWVTVPVDLETIPVFVKAGSFIPMVPDFQSADSYPTDTLILRYYHHKSIANAHYTLFEDDGNDRLSLETGNYETTTCTANATNSRLGIQIVSNDGIYAGKPTHQIFVLTVYHFTQKPKNVLLNNRKVPWQYNKKDRTLTIVCKRTREFQITMKY